MEEVSCPLSVEDLILTTKKNGFVIIQNFIRTNLRIAETEKRQQANGVDLHNKSGSSQLFSDV